MSRKMGLVTSVLVCRPLETIGRETIEVGDLLRSRSGETVVTSGEEPAERVWKSFSSVASEVWVAR
jgi:hypothetical protein